MLRFDPTVVPLGTACRFFGIFGTKVTGLTTPSLALWIQSQRRTLHMTWTDRNRKESEKGYVLRRRLIILHGHVEIFEAFSTKVNFETSIFSACIVNFFQPIAPQHLFRVSWVKATWRGRKKLAFPGNWRMVTTGVEFGLILGSFVFCFDGLSRWVMLEFAYWICAMIGWRSIWRSREGTIVGLIHSRKKHSTHAHSLEHTIQRSGHVRTVTGT